MSIGVMVLLYGILGFVYRFGGVTLQYSSVCLSFWCCNSMLQ